MARLSRPASESAFDLIASDHLAPELEVGHDDLAPEQRLEDLGVSAEVIPGVLEYVETQARHQAFHRTAEVLKWVGEKLRGHNAHSASVAVALGLTGAAPLSEVGAMLGISKQALAKRLEAVRDLFPETAPRAAHRPQREKIVALRTKEPATVKPRKRTRRRRRRSRARLVGEAWRAIHVR